MKRVCLSIILIASFIAVFIQQGFTAAVCVLFTILVAGLAVTIPLWIIVLIIMTCVTGIKEAWSELNPVTMTKEIFFKKLEL